MPTIDEPVGLMSFRIIQPAPCVGVVASYCRLTSIKQRWPPAMIGLETQTRVLLPFAHPHQLIREWAGGNDAARDDMALPHAVECLELLRRTALFVGKRVGPNIGWPSGESPLGCEQTKASRQLQRDFLPVSVRAFRQGGQDGETPFQMCDRFSVGQACRGMPACLQPLIDRASVIASSS
jgi:hypothetical protein